MPERRRRIPKFAQLFVEAVEEAVILPDRLTRTELRLWLLLITRAEWGGHIALSQQQMSDILGINKGDLSRAMATLLKEHLILRERPERGRTWQYQLPTALIHYGPLSQMAWRRDYERSHPGQLTS